jgi:uncharacterized protein (TIGR02145 family)
MKKISLLLIIFISTISVSFGQDPTEITIGKQTWKTQNLKADSFKNGDKIMLAQSKADWEKASRSKVAAYCYYSYQDQINELQESKQFILDRAKKIKDNYTFNFEREAELKELLSNYEMEKQKVGTGKNAKKELAAIETKYKPQIDALTKEKAEHEKGAKQAHEDEYKKSLDGLEYLESEINRFTNLENDLKKGEKYGYLYNYWAVIDPRGLAPDGWKIPTLSDWETLEKFIQAKPENGQPGEAMKSSSGWFENVNGKEYIGNGTNKIGFNGLPGGWRNQNDNEFMNINDFTYWWTSTPVKSSNSAQAIGLDCRKKDLWKDTNNFSGGLSIRLIKDEKYKETKK